MCLLEGDEEGAYARADQTNKACQNQWGEFLGSYLPVDCHGATEKVKAWRAHQGLDGLPEAEKSAGTGEA